MSALTHAWFFIGPIQMMSHELHDRLKTIHVACRLNPSVQVVIDLKQPCIPQLGLNNMDRW